MLSRRRFFTIAGGVLAASAVQHPVLAALRSAPGTLTELRRGVGTYTDRGGTIGWALRDDALVIVDTQYAENAEDTASAFKDYRASSPETLIDLLVNTHHHGDHTGGNGVLLSRSADSVSHQNCVALQKQNAGENSDPAVATTTFDSSWTRDVGDETVSLNHDGAAHTGGDATVFFEKANVVHTGDLVFNHVVPFIDVDGGGYVENWITTLETLHDRYDDDTLFIFGHGNPENGITGSRDGLLQMRDYLTALGEFVAEKRSDGMTAEDMQSVKDLPGFEEYSSENWPLPLAQNLGAVYREQTGDTPATSGE